MFPCLPVSLIFLLFSSHVYIFPWEDPLTGMSLGVVSHDWVPDL